ncbi:LTA synthase family protein [Candidatus Uhrbacteria bacterium]|nr:LTA synthase family protein [Candidatus Uhrbacteria bacterium]
MHYFEKKSIIAIVVATALMSASWSFVRIPHFPLQSFALWGGVTGLIALVASTIAVFALASIMKKFLDTTRTLSITFAARFLLLGSLLAPILVIRDQLAQIVLVVILMMALFIFVRRLLASSPHTATLIQMIDASFLLFITVFVIIGVFQYFGFRYSLIDARYEKIYTIVVFRTFAITLLWMAGAALASLLLRYLPRIIRMGGMFLWFIASLFVSFVWLVNVSVLYYSGRHIGPSALEHLAGADEVVQGNELIVTMLLFLAITCIVGFVVWKFARTIRATTSARGWIIVEGVVLMLGIGIFFGSSILRNTGEAIIARSFIEYYFGKSYVKTLNPILAEKLKKFGLTYTPNAFLVSTHERVYDEKSLAPKLAQRFATTPPNILILFFESFSTRLTSVYNQRFPGLTPGLEKMAGNENTTVFKKFYNASTPTETGMLADLCSFLPPTGHGEIISNGSLTRHQLLCLPEILKKNGYGDTFYMTAIERTYASKDKLFGNAGVDTIYGREQLKNVIPEKPLSWGYSDHQLFPLLIPMMEQQTARPFLGIMTTIDSHPPFTISKDRKSYGHGKNDVLNSFHSTDDAFSQFWDDFQKSPLAANTIVVAIADHAVFPTVSVKALFPEDTRTLDIYDEIMFMMYVPDSPLPRAVDMYASSLDLTPTLLHLLGVNVPNTFEGHSLFDDRRKFPNLVGMHELGLYINQEDVRGKRRVETGILHALQCPREYVPDTTALLTMCDLNELYQWKRTMLEEGRLWKKRSE